MASDGATAWNSRSKAKKLGDKTGMWVLERLIVACGGLKETSTGPGMS